MLNNSRSVEAVILEHDLVSRDSFRSSQLIFRIVPVAREWFPLKYLRTLAIVPIVRIKIFVPVVFPYNRLSRLDTFWKACGDRDDSEDYMETRCKNTLVDFKNMFRITLWISGTVKYHKVEKKRWNSYRNIQCITYCSVSCQKQQRVSLKSFNYFISSFLISQVKIMHITT